MALAISRGIDVTAVWSSSIQNSPTPPPRHALDRKPARRSPGDASDPNIFADLAPVDVLLLVGIFGNIADSDVQRLISTVPAICRPGATIIWTRHRRRARSDTEHRAMVR